MMTREEALNAVHLAIKHLGQGRMVSSARLALEDATDMLSQGEYDWAHQRAVCSISYSVGFLHRDYQELSPIRNSDGSIRPIG